MNLPNGIFNQHLVALGKTGAGKSYALRGLVERLLDDGSQQPVESRPVIPSSSSTQQLGIFTGYSHSSGGFNNALSSLRSLLYITRGQPIEITESGLVALGSYTPLPTGSALADHWMRELSKCEAEILGVLIGAFPNGLSVEEIGARTPSNYSTTSGGFNNAMSRLRTLELITRTKPIRASEELFDQ